MTRLLPTKELWRAASLVNSGIPDHWETVRLSNVVDILNGYAFKSKLFNEKKGLPIIRIRDLGKERAETLYAGPYDSTYIIQSGDVLIGMDGDFRCVIWHGSKGLLNQRVCKIMPNENFINRKLLVYGINRQLKAIQDSTSYLTVTHLSSKTISDIPFPLPPLGEQKRIVLKMEELFRESKTARQSLDKASQILKKFRQSVLNSIFRGELISLDSDDEPASDLINKIKLESKIQRKDSIKSEDSNNVKLFTVPEKWAWTTIGNIFEVNVGGTPRRTMSEFWNGKIPWISSGEVAFCRIQNTKERITQKGVDNSNAKIKPAGTVLLAMIGEGKTRGQAAILDMPAATNQNIASILCSKTPIPPEYLFWWFYYRYNETRSAGEGGAQPALNKSRVESIPIPIPPLSIQKRIVSKIDELFTFVDQMEKSLEDAKKLVNKMDQAIISKAFRGELVPQDPNDEPASVLLEKIKTERENIMSGTKSKKSKTFASA